MRITPVINTVNNNSGRLAKNTFRQNNRPAAKENGQNSSPSFTGKKEGFITRWLNDTFGLNKLIAKGLGHLTETKASKKLVEWTQKAKSPTQLWATLESCAVTFFYVRNTAKSKKIDEERKMPSIIQNIAVTVVSSLASVAVDKACDPLVEKLALAYQKLSPEQTKNLAMKSTKQFYDATNKLKSNTVFTAVVRFIVPVIMVPVVGAIVKAIKNKKEEEMSQNVPQNTQINFKNNPADNKFNNVMMYSPANSGYNKFAPLFTAK